MTIILENLKIRYYIKPNVNDWHNAKVTER